MTVKAKRRIAACVVCLALVACTGHSGIYSLPPVFSGNSQMQPLAVANCVTRYWKLSTHGLAVTSTRKTFSISARSWFHGVTLGVVLQRRGHRTHAEFFEGRVAPPRYLEIVQRCLAPGGGTTNEPTSGLRSHAVTLR
jgi:hypothetical protein